MAVLTRGVIDGAAACRAPVTATYPLAGRRAEAKAGAATGVFRETSW
jgi:hypothetical protein